MSASQYVLSNQYLELTVSRLGAEIKDLIYLPTKQKIMWSGDKKIWNRTAPFLFPYVGKLAKGSFTYQGKEYQGDRHGFARDSIFTLESLSEDSMTFVLNHNAVTKEKFPFDFTLLITYTLNGRNVAQEVTVINRGQETMYFGCGFHPAFALPFTQKRVTSDYYIEFDRPQPALQVVEHITAGKMAGLTSGKQIPFTKLTNCERLKFNDRMFDNDSICFTNFAPGTKSLKLVEKPLSPGQEPRSIIFNIKEFPFVAIWSAISETMHFFCVEPWHTTSDTVNSSPEINKKATLKLLPGEEWSTTLSFRCSF